MSRRQKASTSNYPPPPALLREPPRIASSKTDPLEVGWIALPLPGRLGVTIAPGKQGNGVFTNVIHRRSLNTDLARLRDTHCADLLVDCTEEEERHTLGNAALPDQAEAAGIQYCNLPIRDVTAPRHPRHVEAVVNQVTHLAAAVFQGKTVVVNCRGGRGRSGMIAACILAALGTFPDEAIAAVRAARPGAIETPEQEGFVWQAALRLLRLGWGGGQKWVG